MHSLPFAQSPFAQYFSCWPSTSAVPLSTDCQPFCFSSHVSCTMYTRPTHVPYSRFSENKRWYLAFGACHINLILGTKQGSQACPIELHRGNALLEVAGGMNAPSWRPRSTHTHTAGQATRLPYHVVGAHRQPLMIASGWPQNYTAGGERARLLIELWK